MRETPSGNPDGFAVGARVGERADRVPVEPHRPGWCGLPAIVVVARLVAANGKIGALSVELTPDPEPKPKLHQSIIDLKLSEYEHV